MEPYRQGNRLIAHPARRAQRGITLIGLLFVVALVGLLGLAAVKIAPLYIERMRIGSVLADLQTELNTGTTTAAAIRSSLESRLYIENVEIEDDDVEISREGEGYRVRVNKELRTPYLADLWFLVVVDEQIEIAQ
jgi:Tfp pilus assembly protein FimT